MTIAYSASISQFLEQISLPNFCLAQLTDFLGKIKKKHYSVFKRFNLTHFSIFTFSELSAYII